jgi:MerR family transcriptional regulator, light-induced transcriptional regulator
MSEGGLLRIGELSRRSGVSPELLRAWERRYGLLRPTRSPGGLRLYSADDLSRVREMQHHLAGGLAAAEAAALAARSEDEQVVPSPRLPATARGELAAALDAFDEPRAQSTLDQLLSEATVESVLTDVILPYLEELGERWERGEATVAQEHFSTSVLRGRLLGLARGWGRGLGPLALLACLPGERHELGLMAFGLALRSHGWRVAYFGSDTPLETVDEAVGALEPSLVVLSTVAPDLVHAALPQLQMLASRYRVALGGDGVVGLDSSGLDVIVLEGDPVAEAARVTGLVGVANGVTRA